LLDDQWKRMLLQSKHSRTLDDQWKRMLLQSKHNGRRARRTGDGVHGVLATQFIA